MCKERKREYIFGVKVKGFLRADLLKLKSGSKQFLGGEGEGGRQEQKPCST